MSPLPGERPLPFPSHTCVLASLQVDPRGLDTIQQVCPLRLEEVRLLSERRPQRFRIDSEVGQNITLATLSEVSEAELPWRQEGSKLPPAAQHGP